MLSPVSAPAGVAVDPRERVWVADRGAAAVHVFDLLGQSYKALRGGGKYFLKCPSGIDSDDQGRVYVADACVGAVFVFDSDLAFSRLLPPKPDRRILNQPEAVAISPDMKRVFVADPSRDRVVVLNQEGEAVQNLDALGGGARLGTPSSLAMDRRNKEILVLDTQRQRVEVFNLSGSYSRSMSWGAVRQPSAVAVDGARGLYYLGDLRYDAVHVFDREGKFLASFGQSGSGRGEAHAPVSLHVDRRGFVYWSDALGGKVLVFGNAP